jgi:hypothetical protein
MQVKITKTQLLQIINEETQGEMAFAQLEAARQAYLQDPNDDTRHELGLMVEKLVEPLMNDMGLFFEAEAFYNRGDLVFNNRSVDVTINPKGEMGGYDVNVSPVVSAMDTDPAFEPMNITLPSMKGVVQFINDKVFSSTGMVGEPEAQTELPLEHKMKITKSQLRQLIKEEIMNEINQVSDIDMEDLALVYDDEFGPDYVIGIMAGEFPALDQNEAAFEKALRMFKEAARRGEEDYPLNFLAKRFAELMSKVAAG